MNKKLIIAILVAIVLIGGGIYVYSQINNARESADTGIAPLTSEEQNASDVTVVAQGFDLDTTRKEVYMVGQITNKSSNLKSVSVTVNLINKSTGRVYNTYIIHVNNISPSEAITFSETKSYSDDLQQDNVDITMSAAAVFAQ